MMIPKESEEGANLVSAHQLTWDVDRSGDEAVLPELPRLPDVYNYNFALSQALLQLLITHICVPSFGAEPAELELCFL